MKIEQLYTACLSHGAYYIQCCNEAAIIDPLREAKPYLEKAEKDGVTIKYIFETHFHADFVSGHVDLAKKTGAKIIYGPNAHTDYPIYQAKDEEIFQIGKLKLKVLHTPGHTLESSCYLLYDKEGKEHALFSGDTLFIGDVGRPDLAQKTDVTQEALAGMLYDSLRTKIIPLSDELLIYPAHGAGSACGKKMSKETSDTLGNQKKYNYALREDLTKEEFVQETLHGLLPPPSYFSENVALNKKEVVALDTVLAKGKKALEVSTFEKMAHEEGTLVIDTRSAQDFAKEHIPNAVFIGIDGSFAPWVGALIPNVKQAIIFVADEGREEEVITRLSRIGFDNTLGYLKGGMNAWKTAQKKTAFIESIPAQAFTDIAEQLDVQVLDVRKPNEYKSEHLEKATSFPLDFIHEKLATLDKKTPYYVHCAGGYRSMIACAILKSKGFEQVIDIKGGFASIKKTTLKTTDYICPSTI